MKAHGAVVLNRPRCCSFHNVAVLGGDIRTSKEVGVTQQNMRLGNETPIEYGAQNCWGLIIPFWKKGAVYLRPSVQILRALLNYGKAYNWGTQLSITRPVTMTKTTTA